MNIIPAVDILGGQCVQLVQGQPGSKKAYGDPVEAARSWVAKGAKLLHVVDLDATLGYGNNTEIVLKIKAAVDVPVQLGGGIRSVGEAKELLNAGVDRIIVGTLALDDYLNKTDKLGELDAERLIAAVDSKEGNVVVKGWQEDSGVKAVDVIKGLEDKVWGFLYTNVDVEGKMEGIDLEAIKEVIGATEKPVIISGGISSQEDITEIEKLGAWGIVVGKALYEGKISLR